MISEKVPKTSKKWLGSPCSQKWDLSFATPFTKKIQNFVNTFKFMNKFVRIDDFFSNPRALGPSQQAPDGSNVVT